MTPVARMPVVNPMCLGGCGLSGFSFGPPGYTPQVWCRPCAPPAIAAVIDSWARAH